MTADNIRFPLLLVFCFIFLCYFFPPEAMCLSQFLNVIHWKSAPENVDRKILTTKFRRYDANSKQREN